MKNIFIRQKINRKILMVCMMVSVLFGIILNGEIAQAASNPYPTTQNVDEDAYYEVPCTWFAWQQVYDNFGIALPAWGNAGNWFQAAKNAGYATGSQAKAGSIAVWSGGRYGHVAYVTSASGITFVVNEGGRTDLDHTSSHGVAYGYQLTNATGAARPYDTAKTLLGFIYPQGTPHTHSYSATVTKNATCTAAGVKTFRCSCGSSYTETIAAKGHSYKSTVVAPTMSAKGYTKHTCDTCGTSYKSDYVSPPEKSSDGWYYSKVLPSDVKTSSYVIEYRNRYEKIQKDSPGTGWTNEGVVRNEWVNSGGQYTSEQDLATSDSRVLVRSIYYHFCEPGSNVGNYAQTSQFVHYDELDIARYGTTVVSQGDDEGHTYYLLDWNDGGGRIYCQSGITCDGSYGTHGARCQVWYKLNTYQDRVKVETYKYVKTTGWGTTKDSAATSVEVRFKEKKNLKSVKLSYESCTYDGNVRKPSVTVKNASGETLKVNKDYKVTYASGRKYVGKYQVKVTGIGNYKGTINKYFKINPKKTSISKVTAKSKAIQVKMKKPTAQLTGVQIQYSTNKSFKNAKNVYTKYTTKTISKLIAKKKYYVRVRTYKTVSGTKYYSGWSTIKSVTTKK